MSYFYPFVDSQGKEFGSFEAFFRSPACEQHGGFANSADGSCHDCAMLSGWYWWPCFPGCLPDGEPVGPFATEADAIFDAVSDCV